MRNNRIRHHERTGRPLEEDGFVGRLEKTIRAHPAPPEAREENGAEAELSMVSLDSTSAEHGLRGVFVS